MPVRLPVFGSIPAKENDRLRQKLAEKERRIAALEAGFAEKQMICGHPVAAVVTADEGTSHCGWCEELAEARAEKERLEQTLEIVWDRVKCYPELIPNEAGWARIQMVVSKALGRNIDDPPNR